MWITTNCGKLLKRFKNQKVMEISKFQKVMFDSLQLHGLQHTMQRQVLLSLTISQVCSDLCPSSQWCILSSAARFSFCLPSIRIFSNESGLHIWWPKYWSFSFSISPSNKYSRLISFRTDWFDLLVIQGTLKSLLQHHSLKVINSSVLSLLYGLTLTSIHDSWKNHSADSMDLCW